MKEASIKIGSSVEQKEAVAEVGKAVKEIFEVANKNSIEQETIREALRTLSAIAKVENVTVSGSSFRGDNIVNMPDNDGIE